MNKPYGFILIALWLGTLTAFSQKTNKLSKENLTIHNKDTIKSEEEIVFKPFYCYPSYPGGMVELERFFTSFIKYPGKEGRVDVNFRINKKGELANYSFDFLSDTILRSVVEKAIRAMPKWNPTRSRGIGADIDVAIPFEFVYSPPSIKEEQTFSIPFEDFGDSADLFIQLPVIYIVKKK